LVEALAAGGLDLARARSDTMPTMREMPSLSVELDLAFETKRDTVANVVGILPGSDPNFKKEYVVISAHMDHEGVIRDPTDSIANGANDNAAGVAGLLALAKAYSQPEARPKRSLIFLATSGGAAGFSGAGAFVGSLQETNSWFVFQMPGGAPPLSIDETAVVLDINLDMIGGRSGDTLAIDGLREVDLGIPPAWLANAYPDLGLTIADGGTVFRPRSDHYAFARRVIPSIHIHTGTHDDHVPAADVLAAVDTDQVARILRFVFHLGYQVGNHPRQPRFSAEGREQYVRMMDP
jgi:Zn-dependent M28 family amino/carboxypeptidase